MRFDRGQLLIYAVTDRAWTGKMSLYDQVEAALKGGATMVQMREKGLTDENVQDYLEEARRLRRLTERYNVPFLIDDHVKLALLCGADGVMWDKATWKPDAPGKSLGRIRFWALPQKPWSRR